MTIADCRAKGHKAVSGQLCDGCGLVVPARCMSCGQRLYFGDRARSDGLCAPCRRDAGITPLPARARRA